MIPVLCYHYFGDDRAIQSGIKAEDVAYITPVAEFESTLRLLKTDGFEFALTSNSKGAAGRSCVLTIDDAHRSVLTHALPTLQKLNIPATLFVVPTWVGKDGYLNWSEIQSLLKHGWEIGIHGHTHRRLTTLNDSDIIRELVEARSELQRHLTFSGKAHETMPPLAVPMGGISARVERLARAQGFTYILGSQFGFWDGQSERCIPRFVIKHPYDSADEVRNLIMGNVSLRSIELQFRSVAKQMRDRIIEWKQGRF